MHGRRIHPLRGAGVGFQLALLMVVDRKGIYYDPSRPSELEDILNAMPEHPTVPHAGAGRRPARLILEKELTKYNTGFRAALPPKFPEGKKIVLVPGQVEDDASVRCGGFGMAQSGFTAGRAGSQTGRLHRLQAAPGCGERKQARRNS